MFDAVEIQPFDLPGFDSGDDVITDFGTGDRIDLRGHFEATTFADLQGGGEPVRRRHRARGSARTRSGSRTSPLNELSAGMFLF